jgi:hypothetical protein
MWILNVTPATRLQDVLLGFVVAVSKINFENANLSPATLSTYTRYLLPFRHNFQLSVKSALFREVTLGSNQAAA